MTNCFQKLEHFYSTRVENLKRITKNQETDIKQEDQTRAKSKPENPDAADSGLDSLASIHPEEELEEGVSEQTSESSTRREGSGENAGSGLVVSYEDTFVNLKLKMVDECKQLEYELMEINVSTKYSFVQGLTVEKGFRMDEGVSLQKGLLGGERVYMDFTGWPICTDCANCMDCTVFFSDCIHIPNTHPQYTFPPFLTNFSKFALKFSKKNLVKKKLV